VLAITMSWSWPGARQEVRFASPGAPAKRPIQYSDLKAEFRDWLSRQGISDFAFANYVTGINQSTVERELIGEYDHLIFFLLQSERFTPQPRVEPALSAYEFVHRLPAPERARYLANGNLYLPSRGMLPKSAAVRFVDFIDALNKETRDERMAYFRSLIQKTAAPGQPVFDRLYAEYARSMKFLYQKEFAAKQIREPRQLAAYVSSLYQDRGHSTDTQVEANFALHIALSTLKAQAPATQLNNVLIIGPGLDFAPRTDLIDLFGPQSYQPFAVADALLALKLADAAALRIHCVDINDRVVSYLQGLPTRHATQLSLLSSLPDRTQRPLTDEYKRYFRELGSNIGTQAPLKLPERFEPYLKKSLLVRQAVAERISVDQLNIITERYEPSPRYDLVVVTNVFPYFNATELLLALSNIASMMAEGGYLMHNESRTLLSSVTETLGLPLLQARTVLIASGQGAPLFDGVAIHRKTER
jgi:hypothetical protein